MKKIISLILILIIFVFSVPLSASASYKTSGFEVKSEAAILVSLDTGDVIYEKNADEIRYPASITKIMTAVLLYEHCDNLDTVAVVTRDNVESLFGSDLTVAGLLPEEEVTLRACLNMLMVCSAADAANVIVDYVEAKTGKNFIDLMNEKAKALKMENTHFANATGIHDENHYTTPRDLVKLCKFSIDLPNFLEICSQATYDAPATNKHEQRMVVTTNFLINRATTMYYPYAKGIKTGFTTPAGRCVASTASKDGYNYLCIVMGGDNYTRTEFSDSINLYKWAFDEFEYRTVADTQTMIAEMEVELSSETDYIQLYPEKNVTVIMPEDITNESIIYDTVLKENSVWAPVKKGQVLGYVSIKCAGEEIAKVNLVNNYEIKRSGWLFTLEIIKRIFTSTIFVIIFVFFLIIAAILITLNIISNKRRRARLKRAKKIKRL
ncbi:MAG: D-alanyl-D-alanine carboxypeptidase [Clostridia bacterium]|nr:D-alanyl-D-alanine carboxypeptidase [Clostridia bacterium]